MQVGARVVDEAGEEILDQLGLEVPDQAHADEIFVDQRGTAAQIDRDDGQRFVHGEDEVAGAIDAAAVAKSLREELAEDDTDIFDGVMLVDVEVAFGFQLEVEAAVPGEQLEHMIEEADAGGDLV